MNMSIEMFESMHCAAFMLDVHTAFSATGINLDLAHFVLTYLVEISQEVKSSEGSEGSEVIINSRV